MLKVGITGGIGSGKTTVCQIFQTLGIKVYNADNRAKWLMNHNIQLKQKIKELLGKDAYHRNGRLNRSYVSSLIFSNKELLLKMNKLVHPAVGKDADEWYQNIENEPYGLYEAALLVENQSFKNFDRLIVVTAPTELRIKRVMKRDKSSRIQVEGRIQNQLPQEEKVKVADFIIDNSGEKSLIRQVYDIHQKLVELSATHTN